MLWLFEKGFNEVTDGKHYTFFFSHKEIECLIYNYSGNSKRGRAFLFLGHRSELAEGRFLICGRKTQQPAFLQLWDLWGKQRASQRQAPGLPLSLCEKWRNAWCQPSWSGWCIGPRHWEKVARARAPEGKRDGQDDKANTWRSSDLAFVPKAMKNQEEPSLSLAWNVRWLKGLSWSHARIMGSNWCWNETGKVAGPHRGCIPQDWEDAREVRSQNNRGLQPSLAWCPWKELSTKIKNRTSRGSSLERGQSQTQGAPCSPLKAPVGSSGMPPSHSVGVPEPEII